METQNTLAFPQREHGEVLWKKGTSMIGFMLMWNSLDPSKRAKGTKEVRFVMMFTDDGLDAEEN